MAGLVAATRTMSLFIPISPQPRSLYATLRKL